MKTTVSENDLLLAMFETGHEALKAEKLLKQAGIPLRMVPAPPGLSTGCALAVRFPADALRDFQSVLAEDGLQAKHIFRSEGDAWVAV